MGAQGGELIGQALRQNTCLKHLTIAENDLKSDGAECIIQNAGNLEGLNLGKNYISWRIGTHLQEFLETSKKIKRLDLEFNELLPKGVKPLSEGLVYNTSLKHLNLRGNAIRDEGLELIALALGENQTLESLNISLNEITPFGI